ncbi:hypothetical protein SELMODRAFT_418172 [Selaginella moellendorffii]|uniref:Lipoxygenase domain-containing protein n=1 Tax=Selaginella moellendorffii TaxID=88036 RepID=D8S4W9_SELML|nr:hypothetical protein SELMODRAFT_418172 [Selaginella moellendorffii]
MWNVMDMPRSSLAAFVNRWRMEVDMPPQVSNKPSVLPELEMFCYLVVLIYLSIRDSISRRNLAQMNEIATAKPADSPRHYYSLCSYECIDSLAETRGYLMYSNNQMYMWRPLRKNNAVFDLVLLPRALGQDNVACTYHRPVLEATIKAQQAWRELFYNSGHPDNDETLLVFFLPPDSYHGFKFQKYRSSRKVAVPVSGSPYVEEMSHEMDVVSLDANLPGTWEEVLGCIESKETFEDPPEKSLVQEKLQYLKRKLAIETSWTTWKRSVTLQMFTEELRNQQEVDWMKNAQLAIINGSMTACVLSLDESDQHVKNKHFAKSLQCQTHAMSARALSFFPSVFLSLRFFFIYRSGSNLVAKFQFYAPATPQSLKLSKQKANNDFSQPKPKAKHGLDLLTEGCPYAVDRLNLWSALKQWVTDYTDIFYKDDASLRRNGEKFYLSPSKAEATLVMTTIEILSTHSSDEEYLGTRPEHWTSDKRVLDAFERFKAETEAEVMARNAKNRRGLFNLPYTLLAVSSPPGTGRNSISI